MALGTYLAFSTSIGSFDDCSARTNLSEEIGIHNWDVVGAGGRRPAGDGGRAQLCPAVETRNASLGRRTLDRHEARHYCRNG